MAFCHFAHFTPYQVESISAERFLFLSYRSTNMPPPEARKGFRLYNEVLKNPKYVVAPMVDASELAWRQLARQYGAQLCFTP